ncbi:MAG: class I SAM-dependent methyltransferase [Clostridiaceae bacterium]|nr:class I SAM-dependent methyltransferase [Clostridiaceae bacterium]
MLRWYALKNILKSKIRDGLTILDIGGYDGFIAYNLKKLLPNLKITVVDIDKSGLRLAKEKGLNILNASALKLPIEDNRVDVVLCLDLLEHIKEEL